MDMGPRDRFKGWLRVAGLLAGVALLGLGAYIYSGHYNIAADQPHWFATTKIIKALRDRSIENRTRDIVIPDLESSGLTIRGAGQYDAMYAGCHLAPGLDNSR
jgi:hypothetical protein